MSTEIYLLLDSDARAVVADNGINIARELKKHGIDVESTRMASAPGSDDGEKELISLIVVATAVPIMAVGVAVAGIIKAAYSGPREVSTSYERRNRKTGTIETFTTSDWTEPPAMPQAETEISGPIGLRVTFSQGKK